MTTSHPQSIAADAVKLSQNLKVSRTWLAVALGALLPGLYLIFWQTRVTAEMRAFGRQREDRELSSINSGFLAMTIGWILIVPAMSQLVRTARRVQRCERLVFETRGSVQVVVGAVVSCEVIALLTAVLTGKAIAIPLAILAAGIIEIAVLQPRLNRIWRLRG